MKTLNLAAVAAFLSVSASVFAQSQPPAASGSPAVSGPALTDPAANTSAATHPRDGVHRHGGGHHQHGGRMMRHMDTDGDGQISRAEMTAAHERRMAAFDRADSNRDGKLSREEMRAMGREHRGRHGGPAMPGTPGQPQPRSDGGYGPNG